MLFPLVWYRIIIIFLGPIQKQYNLWNYCDIFSVCFLRRIPIHWHVWTSRGSTLLYIYSPLFSFTKTKSTWKYCFYNQYFTNKIFKETLNTVEIYKKEIVEIVLNQQLHIVTSGFCWVIFQRQLLIN